MKTKLIKNSDGIKTKKQLRVIGDFLKINLPDGKLAFARVLDKASFAIYKIISDTLKDIADIQKSDILFILSAYNDAITSGRWQIIGNQPLENSLKSLPMKFMQDEYNKDKFELYNPNTGEILPAQKKDCIGLERAAVWEPTHVEERILDYINGKSNIWVEKMEIK